MPGFINLSKARDEMRRQGLQGLLITSPENMIYAAGYTPMLLDLYRLAPLSMCFLPADENLPPALFVPETDAKLARNASGIDRVYPFPVWWELYVTGENVESTEALDYFLTDRTRTLPEQYDIPQIAGLTAAMFAEIGLEQARIGIEHAFINHETFAALSRANSGIHFDDSSGLLYRLRSVKTAAEIDFLKKACMLTEGGIHHSAQAIKPGVSIGDLNYGFQSGVLEMAREHGLLDLLGSTSGQPAFGPAGGSMTHVIQPGISTTVKYDMQVSVAHYHSDVGRTYTAGWPTKAQSRLYHALLDAHNCLIEAIRPGIKINEVYRAGREALDRAGLLRVSRGHFGHSVGLDIKIEEPPFISETDTTLLQPGMVLAVETPCYFEGIGKYQIEDMVEVTGTGCTSYNTLPREWN